MRPAFSISLILLSVCVFAQNYVAGGVLAYHGNAYERCIGDLNKALASPGSLSLDTRAKAYFYRGMARAKLYSQNPNARILGEDPVATSLNDLRRARNIDPQWSIRSDKELNKLLLGIRTTAEIDYKNAQNLTQIEGRPIYSRAIDRLQIYLDVRNDFPTRVLLAKMYEAYGDVYFDMVEERDQIQVQRQYLSHYSRAIAHYEEALRLKGEGSKELFQALEILSNRIGDQERETRYTTLIAQIGG